MSIAAPSTSQTPPHAAAALHPTPNAKPSFPTYAQPPGRRHFWLRRVHSLAGLLFGAYVTVHLLVNATGLWPRAYQENVDKIHALEPMLPLIEIVAIFIPLLLHALYGFYITFTGVKFNTMKYNYGGNIRYTTQRWAGVFLLLFVAYHIATLHKWGLAGLGLIPEPLFNPKNVAYQSTVAAIRTPSNNSALNLAVILFYLLATWSAVFHWANGLWTSAITWGLTITANAQRKWGNVCLGFGIIMLLIGTTAWAAFAFGNPNLPVAQTRTLPDDQSETLHAQATGGQSTNSPSPPSTLPSPRPSP